MVIGRRRAAEHKRRRVPRLDAEQQAMHERGRCHRAAHAKRDADGHQPGRLSKHEPIDGLTMCTECHAWSISRCLLTNRVGDDAVQANDAENEGHGREAPEQPRRRALQGCRRQPVQPLRHRRLAARPGRQPESHGLRRQAMGHRVLGWRGTNDKAEPDLVEGDVGARLGRSFRRPLLDVTDDADNLASR